MLFCQQNNQQEVLDNANQQNIYEQQIPENKEQHKFEEALGDDDNNHLNENEEEESKQNNDNRLSAHSFYQNLVLQGQADNQRDGTLETQVQKEVTGEIADENHNMINDNNEDNESDIINNNQQNGIAQSAAVNAQQQQQDDGDDDEQNANQNPALQFTQMVGQMNNEPFLNEETLTGIYELLHLNSPEMFDEIERNSENWKHSVEIILKKRLEIYNKKVELISNIYQQNIPNNSMHNIEKIMSIIKSKEKEIYIYKIDRSPQCCNHENHQHQEENIDNQENLQQEETEQREERVEGRQEQEKEQEKGKEEVEIAQQSPSKGCIDSNHRIQGQNECEEVQDEEAQQLKKKEYNENTLHQQQGQDHEQDSTQQDEEEEEQKYQDDRGYNENEFKDEEVKEEEMTEENLERLKQNLQANEEIRVQQEEQKKILVEENERLKREYDQMIEKNNQLKQQYENQVQIENYLLRKEATAQLERLSNERAQNPNQNENQQQMNQNENGEQHSHHDEQVDRNQHILDNNAAPNDQQLNCNENNDCCNHPANQNPDQEQQNHEGENHQPEQQEQHRHHHHHHHHRHHHHHHNSNPQENNENDNEQSNNNNMNQNREQREGQSIQQKLLGQNFSINDIQSILQMQFVDLQRLKKLNPAENSITFDMNDNYLIKIKSCEQMKYDKTSLCSKIPHFIFKDHIFPFLSSVELFRVRSVSPEWRELVREVWHKTFKRDMQEQLLATDLCKEIEAQFKLMHIRNPFYQKLHVLIRAMVEVINWEDFERRCLENQLNASEKKVVVALLRIIGYDFFNYENINQFEEEHFQRSHVDIAMHMRDFLNQSIQHNGLSSQELKYIYNNFLTQADVSIPMFRNEADKNIIIFILIAKQYFLYSLLRNYISCSSTYMQFAKTKLDALSKDWPTSKGFLEGAYRILLLRNVSIKNGQIVNNDSDDGNDSKLLKKANQTLKKKTKQRKQKKQQQESQEQTATEEKKEKEALINQLEQTEEIQHQQIVAQQDVNQDVTHVENSEQKQDNPLQNQEHNTLNQENSEQKQQTNEAGVQIEVHNQKQDKEMIQEQKEDHEEGDDGEEEIDEEEKDENEDDEEEEDDEQSQTELTQLMKSIFNFQKQEVQEPDIVIKRKTGIMKIFLDQGTKLDIILNTVISVGMQNMQREVHREASELVQNSKNTLDRLEQKFNENQQQIDEMKQKSQHLEKCLIEKQAELEQVQQQNTQLHSEFQKNAEEIEQFENTIQQYEEQLNQQENNQNNQIHEDPNNQPNH